jgi:tetratricopeptide (TPR) repeat protein
MRWFLVLILSVASFTGVASAQSLEELAAQARANPRDGAIQSAYGNALMRAGRFRDAQRALQAAARAQGNTPEAQFAAARVAFAQGDYRASRAACQGLYRIRAQNVLGHVCMARAFLVWNRSARAFEELDAAIAREPNNFEALLALGDAHRLRAATAESEDAYRRAIAANGTSALPHIGLARLYFNARRKDDAIRAYRRALELDPGSPEILFELGSIVEGQEALDMLQRANQGRPDWAAALVALGKAQLAAGQGDAARATLTRAIALSDDYADAHVGLGRVQLAAGELDPAMASFRRALEIVPNLFAAVLGVADVHAAAQRYEEAFAEYRAAAGLDPSDPTPLVRAAELALTRNRDVLAAGFLDRVLQSNQNHATALALYGDVMRARRDRNGARQYYERALRAQGPVDRARVQAALRELGGTGPQRPQR